MTYGAVYIGYFEAILINVTSYETDIPNDSGIGIDINNCNTTIINSTLIGIITLFILLASLIKIYNNNNNRDTTCELCNSTICWW